MSENTEEWRGGGGSVRVRGQEFLRGCNDKASTFKNFLKDLKIFLEMESSNVSLSF